jgi:hypothetical protein
MIFSHRVFTAFLIIGSFLPRADAKATLRGSSTEDCTFVTQQHKMMSFIAVSSKRVRSERFPSKILSTKIVLEKHYYQPTATKNVVASFSSRAMIVPTAPTTFNYPMGQFTKSRMKPGGRVNSSRVSSAFVFLPALSFLQTEPST